MFIWLCQSTGLCVCCVFVWCQIRVPAKKPHVSDLSKLDTLLHKTHLRSYLRLDISRSAISLSKTLWSPIQPKKQDSRKSSGVGGWGDSKRGRESLRGTAKRGGGGGGVKKKLQKGGGGGGGDLNKICKKGGEGGGWQYR